MKSTNKTLIPIFVCVLLSACSKRVDEVEETPVEIRQRHIVSEHDLYIVQDGDTVGSIATAYGVTRGELIKTNNLAPPYRLFEGQKLIIPATSGYVDAEVLNSAQPRNFNSKPDVQNSKFKIVQKGGLKTEYDNPKVGETTAINSQENSEQLNISFAEQSDENTAVNSEEGTELVEVDETPISSATYVWPVANGRSRISKAFDNQSGNILISTPGLTPVRAVASGVVKMAGKSGNEQLVRFGNMIVIQHKTLEKVSIYANVIDLKVKVGQTVSAGDLIASVSRSGIRGMTTTPTLYFEIDKTANGKKRQPIDPRSVLP